jgi:hypothetical protein
MRARVRPHGCLTTPERANMTGWVHIKESKTKLHHQSNEEHNRLQRLHIQTLHRDREDNQCMSARSQECVLTRFHKACKEKGDSLPHLPSLVKQQATSSRVISPLRNGSANDKRMNPPTLLASVICSQGDNLTWLLVAFVGARTGVTRVDPKRCTTSLNHTP